MSHSTACLTCLFNKLMGVGDCRGAWNHSKVSRCIPTRIVGCIVWSYPHKPRIAGKFLRPPGQWTSISQVLFDPGLTYVDMRSLPRAVGCWRQAPRSHPPFVFLLPCGQELARSWKHPHGLPPPSVHDTFSDSAQIQPHPKQIPNPKYKIKKNLTYPEGKRERERRTFREHHNFAKAICRCRPPRVPRMRMARMQRLQPATVRLKVSRTRRQRKAIPRRAKVCGAIWHIFFRTTKGRGLSVRRWREQRRRKLKRGWMKIWCIFS